MSRKLLRDVCGRRDNGDADIRRGGECRAREIIEANHYLVLATADAAGDPWSTPVYFAHIGYREQYWVSSPTAAHSRNIAARATVRIAIFDSHTRIGTGQGVYMSAIAAQVKDTELAPSITVFSDRSLRHGGVQWPPTSPETPSYVCTAPPPTNTGSSPRTANQITGYQSTLPSDPAGYALASRPAVTSCSGHHAFEPSR